MAWEDFKFTPEDGLSNTTTFPSKPASGVAARAQFMTILNQIKAFLNGGVKDYVDEHKAENVHIGKNEAVRVYNNVNQSIPNNTDTYLSFNSERFDNSDMHDDITNNSRLTCTKAGYYLIIAHVGFNNNATGDRLVRLCRNRSGVIGMMGGLGSSAERSEITVSTLAQLNVGDYVEVRVMQNSGTALDVLYNSGYSPEFMMVKVG